MGKLTNCKDLLMLLLFASGHQGVGCQPIIGRTRLMKMVFLFEREMSRRFNFSETIPASAYPDFEAYDFGPFAKEVFADLEFLISLGFVQEVRTDEAIMSETESLEDDYWRDDDWFDDGPGMRGSQEPATPYRYSLTPTGEAFVKEELLPNLSQEQRQALDEFKSRCTAVTLNALLKYVYTKYPEATTKSKIRDEVLGA